MARNFFVLFLIVCFSSCEKKTATPEEMILGNWSIVNKDSIELWKKQITGYSFMNNGSCDYKPGYWDWNRYENDRSTALKSKRIADLDNEILYYLGTRTKYSISKNTLKIFNPTEKQWEDFKIKKISKDTLVILRDTIATTFVKKNYNISNIPDFDAVILSSSPRYGSCTTNSIIVYNTGEIIYKGDYHVVKEGWHTTKIPASEFNVIMNRFKEADYMNLKKDYSTAVTDSQYISISFIKNGKIIKTIDDYADSAPNEFIWAYTPLIYLGQKLNLNPKKTQTYFKDSSFYSSFVTIDEVKGMNLSPSEVFYLITLLMDAKDVDFKFDEKYLMRYNNDYIKEVKTDGRYYKLYLKNGKTEIKDIGFNYITDNKLSDKIEIIKKINEQNYPTF